MSNWLRCARGHRWEWSDDGGPARAGPVACPLCGQLCTPDEFSSLDLGDDLPSPPPPPPVADHPADPTLPKVPGYQVLEWVGEGGMGVVYKARQVVTNRLAAVKMIADGPADLAARARFLAEAEAAARLRHPGVVQIYEVGDADGRPFLALEFCEGGCLADRLDGTPLPPDRAAGIVEQLARAMHAGHKAGIVHRDLKPANVLLTYAADRMPEPGEAKIADFGLARLVDADRGQTKSGMILGTPSYMAPEQATGDSKHVGPAADIYALGAILYELLTGRPPFRGATLRDTLEQVLIRDPVPPRRLRPEGAAGPGDGLPEVPAEGAGPPLPDGRSCWPTTCGRSPRGVRSGRGRCPGPSTSASGPAAGPARRGWPPRSPRRSSPPPAYGFGRTSTSRASGTGPRRG